MPTRTNIILIDNIRETKQQLFRMNDGYPEVTGAELKRACKAAKFDKDGILSRLDKIKSKYTGLCQYVKEPESENIHGDIDWLYIIDLNNHTLTAYKVRPFFYVPDIEYITLHCIEKKELIK